MKSREIEQIERKPGEFIRQRGSRGKKNKNWRETHPGRTGACARGNEERLRKGEEEIESTDNSEAHRGKKGLGKEPKHRRQRAAADHIQSSRDKMKLRKPAKSVTKNHNFSDKKDR